MMQLDVNVALLAKIHAVGDWKFAG